MDFFNLEFIEKLRIKLTYKFVVHSNESARRKVDILGWTPSHQEVWCKYTIRREPDSIGICRNGSIFRAFYKIGYLEHLKIQFFLIIIIIIIISIAQNVEPLAPTNVCNSKSLESSQKLVRVVNEFEVFLVFRFCRRICAAVVFIGVIYSCESSVLYFDFTLSSSIVQL